MEQWHLDWWSLDGDSLEQMIARAKRRPFDGKSWRRHVGASLILCILKRHIKKMLSSFGHLQYSFEAVLGGVFERIPLLW